MEISDAREKMWESFKNDPDFARTYKDQIACFIMDNFPGYKSKKEERDKLADQLFVHLYKEEKKEKKSIELSHNVVRKTKSEKNNALLEQLATTGAICEKFGHSFNYNEGEGTNYKNIYKLRRRECQVCGLVEQETIEKIVWNKLETN